MVMKVVSKRLNSLLKERNISVFELAKHCPGVSQSSIYNVKKGSGGTTVDTLEGICEGLEIPIQSLFDEDGVIDYHLTEDERELIETNRQLNSSQRQRLMGYAQSMVDEKKRK